MHRRDLHRIETHSVDPPALQPGQVRLAVRRFALTANNFTYATLGETAGFWRVFPAPAPWGRIPAWGFAEVIASGHDEVSVGEQVFGMLPMATRIVVEPERVTPRGFVDASVHRRELFPIYNHYARVARSAAADEDLHAVVRPLFFTSFVLDDHLADQGFFGARTLLLSSASSKTALGAAFLLRGRCAVRVCGLTSALHRDFVARTGCFDAVQVYDDVGGLKAEPPVVYLDFAGAAALRQAVHEKLGSGLVRSIVIGSTHRTELDGAQAPGIAPQPFFGPEQLRKRREEWGAQALQQRYDAAEKRFAANAACWLEVERWTGWSQLEPAYRRVLEGRVDPARAVVVEFAVPTDPTDQASDVAATPAEERAARSLLSREPGLTPPQH